MLVWWLMACVDPLPVTSTPTESVLSEPPTAASTVVVVPTADTGAPCESLQAGTWHDQVFPHGGHDRVYTLHVPEGLGCRAPVLVDLHGAYGGPEAEKAYVLQEALAAADEHRVVLVRPRGLETVRYGVTWTYWNVPGELVVHADFLDALVSALGTTGPRWVMGYSSGADLTGWMLSEHRGWDGYGMVAGASWSTHTWLPFEGEGPPVYTQFGSRDALDTHDLMLDELSAAGHPSAQRFVDTGAGGHRLARLHYDRAIPWFREGGLPERAPRAEGWQREPVSDVPLLSIDRSTSALRVGDSVGRVWVEGEAVERSGGPLNGVCGDLVAGYGLRVLASGTTALPLGTNLYAYAHDLACDGDGVTAVGDKVYHSDDGGQSWSLGPSRGGEWYGVARQGDRAVAVGQYNAVASTVDGELWSVRGVAPDEELWLYGAAIDGETMWVVGEQGFVGRSDDDGSTWVEVDRLSALPLYAVDASGGRLVVAGHDGGLWWRDGDGPFGALPLDVGFVADVQLRGDEVWVAASDGAVYRRPWPGG